MIYKRERRKKKVEKKVFPLLDDIIAKVKQNHYNLMVDGISQSLLSNFTCRVKFALALDRWTTIESGKNTYFGDMCHYVLERVYTPPDKGKPRMPRVERIRKWIEQYVKKKEKQLEVWTSGNIDFAAGLVEIVLKYYCQYYKNDFKEIDVIFSEEKFDVPFHNARLKGMRDVLFTYKERIKENWIMEHKTMGNVNHKVLIKRLPIDKQNLFYALSTQLEYNIDLTGVLFNVIRRPLLRQGKDEDTDDFLDRIDIDISNRPEHYFIRYPIYYTQADIERFRKNLVDKLDCVHNLLQGNGRVFRNEDACESAYNGSPYVCEFIDICQSGKIRGFIQQDSLFPELEE